MSEEQTVFVVDDDIAIRDSLSWFIESVGINVQTYASPKDFLDIVSPLHWGCAVLDIRLPGMSGLELQERLAEVNVPLQVIIISGYADVSMAVQAMKANAFDIIQKPFNPHFLLTRIQEALEEARKARDAKNMRTEFASLLKELTRRERQVLDQVMVGRLNKVIAADLGISNRTVEVHRARVMEKMNVRSVAELVRIGIMAGVFK